MRALFIISLILVLHGALYSQTQTAGKDSIEPPATRGSNRDFRWELFAGKKYFENNFYGQLNGLSSPNLNQPLSFIGFGSNGAFVVNRTYTYCGHFALLYIIPQNIKIDSALSGKITGYLLSASFIGWDIFKKNKTFDLIVSLGANAGRVRILGNDMLKQKNPYLGPMVSLVPALYFKKIKFALNLQYDYDITRSRWRSMPLSKSEKVFLKTLRQSGLSAFLCIGLDLR